MPVTDDELRRQLGRRATADTLSDAERDRIVSVARGRRTRNMRPTAWLGWAGGAAAVLLLAALAVNVLPSPVTTRAPESSSPAAVAPSPTFDQASPTAAASPLPSASPAPIPVLSVAELAAFARDPLNGDRVVFARVRLDASALPENFGRYEECSGGEFCPMAMITDGDPPILVFGGFRRSTPDAGVIVQDDGSDSFWGRLLEIPTAEELMAFRGTGQDDRIVYLGPVAARPDGNLVWTVDDLIGGGFDSPSDNLYAVDGWMVQTESISCPAHQDLRQPGVSSSYWCGGTYVTQDRVTLVAPDKVQLTPDGLHVEWDTYSELYPDADFSQETGYEPIRGTYLVRPAGCPPAVMGACPVWSFAGALELPIPTDPAATPGPTPTAAVEILSAGELAQALLERAPGSIVLSDAAVGPLSGDDPRCLVPRCQLGILASTTEDIRVFLRSSATAGSVGAFRILDHRALERLGDVEIAGPDAWSVNDLRATQTRAGVLYAVDAWLIQPADVAECPDAPDTSPDADFSYWCGASWLTAERVELPSVAKGESEVVPPGALQVQNRAYQIFASNPLATDAGVEPWHDVFLVREVGCPANVLGDCPVWELVAGLDTHRPPHPTSCFDRATIADGPLLTSQEIAAAADAIVVGVVHEVGPGFWDVATGERPISFDPDAAILTRVETDVETVIKGDGASAERTTTNGGTVGCDTHQFSPSPQLTEGRRYVLFLRDGIYRSPDAWPYPFVSEAWLVDPAGQVRDPRTGESMSLESLAAYLLGLGSLPTPDFSDYVTDELLVRFCGRPTSAVMDQFASEHGLVSAPQRPVPNLFLFRIVDGVDAAEKQTTVSDDPLVCRVTLNWLGELQ